MSREIWADGAGRAQIREAPARTVRPGHLRVRVVHSAVSWGTEAHMLGRGFRGRLGYQAAGRVMGVAGSDGTLVRGLTPVDDPQRAAHGALLPPDRAPSGFGIGQAVAVYGAPFVGHADELWVPPLLAAPLGEGTSLAEAAYLGLGAIALEGIRLSGLSLGEVALVAGLGMVGQWTVRLLEAAGVGSVAVDPLPVRRSLAIQGGAAVAISDPDPDTLSDHARALGRPDGRFDSILLAMGTDDGGTIDRYIGLCSPGGTVVIVGDIPVTATRELLFQSEVRLVVSHAAGPGRGDPRYEAEGQDYPVSHIRWTEGRNLRAASDLLSRGRVDLTGLIGPAVTPEALAAAYAAGSPPEAVGTVVAWPA